MISLKRPNLWQNAWKITLLRAIPAIVFTTTSYAHESVYPPHPITSFGITERVLSKAISNSHYKVIGSCIWATGSLPPKLVVTPAIEQFLPDLVVTVANLPETNPWVEAKTLFENSAAQRAYQNTYKLATGFELGFGNDSSQTNAMHINDERTRVVDVIGSPIGFYRFNKLSHRPETYSGTPYYLSEADAVSDRTEIAEIVYMATHPQLLINHDIGTNGAIWGHEVPRSMRITHPSRFRASVVAALHAADLVTNKNSMHVAKSTSNSCGDNCVVSNVIFDPERKQIIWQEVYPKNRNIKFNESDNIAQADDKAGNGNYVFVVWRKYKGCIPTQGKLVSALSFPKVGSPQKR